MRRHQMILNLSDPNAPLEARKEACGLLRDIQEDEPEFEAGMRALMAAAHSGSPIRGLAQSVLDTINERRHEQANRALQQSWLEILPEGILDPTTLVPIFEDQNESWERRSAACLALSELNPPGIVQVLLGKFQDDADLAFQIGNALSTIRRLLNRPIFEATDELSMIVRKAKHERLREAGLYALRWVGDPAAADVAIEIFDSSEPLSPELRRAALEVLVRGTSGGAYVLKALRDTSPLVRVAAIGLANTSIPEVREIVLGLLQDETTLQGEGTVADAVRSKLAPI